MSLEEEGKLLCLAGGVAPSEGDFSVSVWFGRPLRHEVWASHREAVRLRPRVQLQLLPAEMHLKMTMAGLSSPAEPREAEGAVGWELAWV